MKRMRIRPVFVVSSALLLALAACGDDEDVATSSGDAATIPLATAAPSTTESATTVPETTAVTTSPPTTASPSTTAPTATTPPSTSVPANARWQPVEFTPAVFPVGYSGNYEGVASPPAPSDPGGQLADGYYWARVVEPWSPESPNQLQIEVGSFAPCADIGDACYENLDGPDELGVDPASTQTLDVPLDASTSVIVRGFRCFDDDEIKRGDGAALADLFAAYDADYTEWIAPLVESGMDGFEVMEAIAENPAGGFAADAEVCGGGEQGGYAGVLRYSHEDAPMLLLQSVTRYNPDGANLPLGATDLVSLQGVDVRSGVMTWYFYAGFYS